MILKRMLPFSKELLERACQKAILSLMQPWEMAMIHAI